MALITQNIDHHGRTRNLYPWTNLVAPLIRTPKNMHIVLMHFRLQPILTTRHYYLYKIVPGHHHLCRSVIMRLPTRRLYPSFQTGNRLWIFGTRTTTTTEQGAANVLLCDLVRTYHCVFSFGKKIFEQLPFSWSFFNAFDM